MLAIMIKEERRVARLIDDLLDLGRIRSGQLGLELSTFDLCDLVNEVGAPVEGSDVGHRIDAEVRVRRARWSAPGIGRASIRSLPTSWRTLSSTDREGPVIVRVAADSQRGSARLEVRDNGPGIPPELHGRIFEPFKRAVPTGQQDGLGLGLYIVRSIVAPDGRGGSRRQPTRCGRDVRRGAATSGDSLTSVRASRRDGKAVGSRLLSRSLIPFARDDARFHDFDRQPRTHAVIGRRADGGDARPDGVRREFAGRTTRWTWSRRSSSVNGLNRNASASTGWWRRSRLAVITTTGMSLMLLSRSCTFAELPSVHVGHHQVEQDQAAAPARRETAAAPAAPSQAVTGSYPASVRASTRLSHSSTSSSTTRSRGRAVTIPSGAPR